MLPSAGNRIIHNHDPLTKPALLAQDGLVVGKVTQGLTMQILGEGATSMARKLQDVRP
jgi:hypothetical protein